MPTDITKTIGSGGDYSTPQAWEDALPVNLVTVDERWIGEGFNEEFVDASGNGISFAGSTTDATRYPYLKTNGSSSFKDNANVRTNALDYNAANGTALRCTDSYINGISIATNFVRVEGWQVNATGTSSMACAIANDSATINKCILKATGRAVNITGTATSGKILNCLLLGVTFAAKGFNNWDFRNCTAIKSGAVGGTAFEVGYGTWQVINTAAFGWSDFDNVGTGGSFTGSQYNATDLAAAPGTNNQVSLTYANQFENSASDWRAKSTGSLQAGTPDATNCPDDISDLTRNATTPWIGAWEVAAAGGGTILPIVNQLMLAG